MEHVDVLIVGAGISGIGAACHLRARCPSRSYTILEGRSDIGGTWDLFRYPGVRSDSDMQTLGFRFKPDRGQIDRRRPVDPAIPPRHLRRTRRRPADPVRPPGEEGGVVEQRRPVDRDG